MDEKKMNNLPKAEEELEKMTAPEGESPPGESPPINDQQEPAEDSDKHPLPTGAPLSAAEQLAHTQVAYQALLEDFTKVSRELVDLKEVPGDTYQVGSLQGQVEDLKERVSELDEAVRLKQQVIDKLETRVTDLQMANQAEPAEPALPADLKSLLQQVADLQEANRILRLRLQS